MTQTRVYHLEAMGQFTPEAARQIYGGAIVDSTRRLAGGAALCGGFIDPDGIDRSFVDLRLALAFAFSEMFSVGVGGRYLKLDQEGFGPLGQSRASGGLMDAEDPPRGRNALVDTVTFDAGMSIRPTEGLVLAAVGQSLSYPDNGVLPTTLGGGIGYGSADFSLEADALADFNSWRHPTARAMAGGEYLIANHFPVRAGYRFDHGAGSHALSAGLGYLDSRFSVEASVRRTLAGPASTTIVVGIAYFLESSGLAPVEEP
ncbi:MAG: hypothetical protein HY744_05185 [Deltaproteobacteria bacterium]|nr:hypothetical protein [Deltaproteobacteria bacterium]